MRDILDLYTLIYLYLADNLILLREIKGSIKIKKFFLIGAQLNAK